MKRFGPQMILFHTRCHGALSTKADHKLLGWRFDTQGLITIPADARSKPSQVG